MAQKKETAAAAAPVTAPVSLRIINSINLPNGKDGAGNRRRRFYKEGELHPEVDAEIAEKLIKGNFAELVTD